MIEPYAIAAGALVNQCAGSCVWHAAADHVRREAMKLTNALILGSGCRLDGHKMLNVR